jgi:hypothetical protein
VSKYYSRVTEDKINQKIEWAEKLLLKVNEKRSKEKLKPIRSPNFRNLNKKQIIELLGLTPYESISLLKPLENSILDKEEYNETDIKNIEKELEKKLKKKEYLIKRKEELSKREYYFLKEKIERFKTRSAVTKDFDYLDVIKKFGDNPKCYLTGLPINYNDSKSYSLDHFIPVAKGGTSDLDNMRLANPMANEMKRHYELHKFLEICRLITENNSLKEIT